MLLKKTKDLCRRYDLKPLRRRGQNFLINEFFVEKVIVAAELKKTDIVLEIGTGLGSLTKAMAGKVRKIITVEIDKKLVEIAKNELRDFKNVDIIQGSISDQECFNVLMFRCSNEYKVVANIPFNLTGLILRKFLNIKNKPESVVLIMQKEVGERIIAQPPRMSRLSVMIGIYGSAEITGRIGRNNFWPRPAVDSIILRIKPGPLIVGDEENFFKIVNAGFSSPRKYLLNNLVKNAIINKEEAEEFFFRLGLPKKIRAQELSVADWVKMAENLS